MQVTDIKPASAFTMYKRSSHTIVPKKKRKRSKSKPTSTSNGEQDHPKSTKGPKLQKQVKIEPSVAKKNKKTQKIINGKPPGITNITPDVTERATIKQTKAKNKQSHKKLRQQKAKALSDSDEDVPTLVAVDSLDPENKLKDHDDPRTACVQSFEWIIAPIQLETFFQKYWESAPFHVVRSNREYYKQLLDTATLDRMLRENPLYYNRNVDVVSYENGVKEVFNQEGRATPSALWDYFSNGCSIRILNPQTYNFKIHLLLATLQEYFGTMVGANVYLTPPGSQGFAPHYDDIEAFVVQLEGRKHWKLYKPKDSDVLARDSSGNFKREELDAPFMQLTLQAGEILYFPRGTIHEGETDADSHSLHITVSVYQHTAYADLLEHLLPAALKKAAFNNVEYRKGLPVNYLQNFGASSKPTKAKTTIIETVKKLIKGLADYADVDNAASQLGRKFMYDSMPPVLTQGEEECSISGDGPVMRHGKILNRVEIGPDTKVRLLRYYCLNLVADHGVAPKLYYNTDNARVYHGEEEQWLELEPEMVPLIGALQSSYPTFRTVESLPMDDITVKMQIVSDLWERGLLLTEQPLDCIDELSDGDSYEVVEIDEDEVSVSD